MTTNLVAITTGAFVLAGMLLAGPAVAGGGKGKKKTESVEEKFKKLDTNNDGKLNKEEFAKLEPNKQKRGTSKKTTNRDKFIQFDKNNDGFISQEEFRKIYEYRAKK